MEGVKDRFDGDAFGFGEAGEGGLEGLGFGGLGFFLLWHGFISFF